MVEQASIPTVITHALTPGAQTSEMKVLIAASVLTAIAGAFHKQLDDKTAIFLVNGLAGLYIMGRNAVKVSNSLASAVMIWIASQKAQTPEATPPGAS